MQNDIIVVCDENGIIIARLVGEFCDNELYVEETAKSFPGCQSWYLESVIGGTEIGCSVADSSVAHVSTCYLSPDYVVSND